MLAAVHESGSGLTLTTWVVQQVGSYLGYTGRGAGVVAKAAFDPKRRFASVNYCIAKWAIRTLLLS